MSHRHLLPFLVTSGLLVSQLFAQTSSSPADSDRTLYNGIVLPEVWPPRDGDEMSVEPMKMPYLANPPKVIPIDVGRQLFVDDFLIEQTDLTRTFHAAEKYTGNPVIKASTKEELLVREDSGPLKNASGGTVALLHGGAFYDPEDHHLKLWFSGGSSLHFDMARSRDGIHWERGPDKIANPATVVPVNDCFWLDLEARDPAQRLKLQAVARAKPSEQHLHKVELSPLYHAFFTSANGAKWSDAVPSGNSSDYSSFFYNPFRKRWIYSIKASVPPRHRLRRYAESAEFATPDIFNTSVFWVGADKLDQPDPKVGDTPQLYSLGAVGYESLMLGMFYIHVGPHNTVCQKLKSPKHIDLKTGFSRDGFHWDRPFRESFIASTRTEGTWDKGYVHSPAGILFVMGDKLIFPYSGCSGTAPDGRKGMYAGQSIGLAMLRRDGFASMNAGEKTGTLTTRPVLFKGEHLFVNMHAPDGELRIEALSEDGKVIAASEAARGDSTKQLIKWKDSTSLAKLSGKPVRFRFHLTNGQLYAFWVTPDPNGASFGYLGGGSPEANGVRDMPPPTKL